MKELQETGSFQDVSLAKRRCEAGLPEGKWGLLTVFFLFADFSWEYGLLQFMATDCLV